MGVKLNLKSIFALPSSAGVPPELKVRVIGTAIRSSAILVSKQRKSKAVRRKWIVADDIRGSLELVRMLIDAGIRPQSCREAV